MAWTLLLSRRFAPLFWCQFFSAFSDNFLKNALAFLVLFQLGGPYAEMLVTLAAAVFIAPYFVLSGLGGEWADRYDKARVARRLKFAELGVALVAVAGFLLHSVPLLFAALFLFGVIAALFGPIKYGILPDHLAVRELPTGNALVEGATFVAILLGTIAGGLASRGDRAFLSLLMAVCAVVAWAASRWIPATGEAAPGLIVRRDILASTGALIRHLRGDPKLRWGALVTSWFWLVGAVTLALLPPLVKRALGGDEATVTAYLALFTVAVAAGSGLAAWIAAGRIELRTTLAGAVLLGVFALDLGWASGGGAGRLRIGVDLAGLAMAGGLYIVPVFAAVQVWAGRDHRARVVAGVNVLNAGFMVAGAVAIAALQAAGATPSSLFLLLGAASLAVAAGIWRTSPRG